MSNKTISPEQRVVFVAVFLGYVVAMVATLCAVMVAVVSRQSAHTQWALLAATVLLASLAVRHLTVALTEPDQEAAASNHVRDAAPLDEAA